MHHGGRVKVVARGRREEDPLGLPCRAGIERHAEVRGSMSHHRGGPHRKMTDPRGRVGRAASVGLVGLVRRPRAQAHHPLNRGVPLMLLELVRPCPARILDAQPYQAVPTTSELLDAHLHGSPRHRSKASAERRLEEQLAVETGSHARQAAVVAAAGIVARATESLGAAHGRNVEEDTQPMQRARAPAYNRGRARVGKKGRVAIAEADTALRAAAEQDGEVGPE